MSNPTFECTQISVKTLPSTLKLPLRPFLDLISLPFGHSQFSSIFLLSFLLYPLLSAILYLSPQSHKPSHLSQLQITLQFSLTSAGLTNRWGLLPKASVWCPHLCHARRTQPHTRHVTRPPQCRAEGVVLAMPLPRHCPAFQLVLSVFPGLGPGPNSVPSPLSAQSE